MASRRARISRRASSLPSLFRALKVGFGFVLKLIGQSQIEDIGIAGATLFTDAGNLGAREIHPRPGTRPVNPNDCVITPKKTIESVPAYVKAIAGRRGPLHGGADKDHIRIGPDTSEATLQAQWT